MDAKGNSVAVSVAPEGSQCCTGQALLLGVGYSGVFGFFCGILVFWGYSICEDSLPCCMGTLFCNYLWKNDW